MIPSGFRERNITSSMGMSHAGSLACRASMWQEQTSLSWHEHHCRDFIFLARVV